MPLNLSDIIALNPINTGGNSAGNGGDSGDIEGPVVNVPIFTSTPINVALGGDANQGIAQSVDMSQDVVTGDAGDGGNDASADSGDVALTLAHDLIANVFDDFVDL